MRKLWNRRWKNTKINEWQIDTKIDVFDSEKCKVKMERNKDWKVAFHWNIIFVSLVN